MRTGFIIDACEGLIQQHQPRGMATAFSTIETGDRRKKWNSHAKRSFPAGCRPRQLSPLAVLMSLHAKPVPATVVQRLGQLFDQAKAGCDGVAFRTSMLHGDLLLQHGAYRAPVIRGP